MGRGGDFSGVGGRVGGGDGAGSAAGFMKEKNDWTNEG